MDEQLEVQQGKSIAHIAKVSLPYLALFTSTDISSGCWSAALGLEQLIERYRV